MRCDVFKELRLRTDTMRISTQQLQSAGINAILNRQAEVSRTQAQLSTGKQIISPADDPAGAARIENFRQAIERTEQFQDNIVLVRQRLDVEESNLESAGNILQRIRELTIQGKNDTFTFANRRAVASEVRQRLGELLSFANARDANGEYIFSGFQGLTKPFSQNANGSFVYNGDQGQRLLQVNESRQIADRDSGAAVFQKVRNGNGTFTTLDNTANTGAGVINVGSVTDPTLIDGDTYTLRAVDNASVTTGGGVGTITDNAATANVLEYRLVINGQTVYTQNEAATPLASLTAVRDAINGASDVNVALTGVRAYVDTSANRLYLSREPASTQAITVVETLVDTGATALDTLDTVTGYFGSSLAGDGTASVSNTTTFTSAADSYLVLDSSNNIETSGAYLDGSQISFNGIATDLTGTLNNGDSFSISPSVNQDIFTILENLATALEGGLSGAAPTTAFHNAMNRVLSDLGQAEEKINEIRGTVGSRLNALDSQENSNEDFILDLRTSLSNIEDLDFAEATGRFNLELVGLKAAQQAYVRVQGLSLFNFL